MAPDNHTSTEYLAAYFHVHFLDAHHRILQDFEAWEVCQQKNIHGASSLAVFVLGTYQILNKLFLSIRERERKRESEGGRQVERDGGREERWEGWVEGEERGREGLSGIFHTFVNLCLKSQNEFPRDVSQQCHFGFKLFWIEFLSLATEKVLPERANIAFLNLKY